MGDREWVPRDSELKILEGPRMETADLSFGQGWSNAERASANVTKETLLAAPPARHARRLRGRNADAGGGRRGRWPAITAGRSTGARPGQKLDGRDPEIAAVILVLRKGEAAPPP